MTDTHITPTATAAEEGRRHPTPRHAPPPHSIAGVRETDLEPYIGLRYLSKLFRLIAIILILLLIAEVVTGVMQQGSASIPTLLAEASRLIVFAGLLWGAGDLAILLIDMGHDLRATRILLSRQLAHHMAAHHEVHGTHQPGESHSAGLITD
jgi:hypothetical protein